MGRSSKFQDLPNVRSCLYAILLTNGVVKVGLTRSPMARIRSLQTEARRLFGADIQQHVIGHEIPARHLLFYAESELLKALGRVARVDAEHREYFHSLDYQVAVVLLEQITWRFHYVGLTLGLQTAKRGHGGVVDADEGADSLNSHGLKHVHASPATPHNVHAEG